MPRVLRRYAASALHLFPTLVRKSICRDVRTRSSPSFVLKQTKNLWTPKELMSQVGVDIPTKSLLRLCHLVSSVFYGKKPPPPPPKKNSFVWERCRPFNHVTHLQLYSTDMFCPTGATLKSLQAGFHAIVKWSETKNGLLFQKKKEQKIWNNAAWMMEVI